MNSPLRESPPSDVLPRALRRELERCYDELAERIAALGPTCWTHGRCCDFTRMDHRLYASSVEVAWVKERHGTARAPGGMLCPFWRDGLCTERERRPLGCRTHFCDRRYRIPLEALHEEYLARLREAAERAGFPWTYAPFVEELAR